MTHGDPEAFLVIHASPDDIHPTPWGQFLSIPLEFFAAIAGRDLILLRRSSDEVSVLSFACTASCTSTAQAQAFFWVEL